MTADSDRRCAAGSLDPHPGKPAAVRWVAYGALACAVLAVILTILDDGHLGLADGSWLRALRTALGAAAFLGIGWVLGAKKGTA